MTLSPAPHQDFFENYAEAVLIANADEKPVLINAAFTRLTGFNKHSLPDTKILFGQTDVLPKSKKPMYWKTSLTKLDGHPIVVNVSVSKITLPDESEGRIYTLTESADAEHLQILLRESERLLLKAKQEIVEQDKRIVQITEELEQLAYVVSHDMQEPLRMVTSYIQLIQRNIEQGNTGNVVEFMKYVSEGAERMQALTADLLQLSRVNRKGNNFAETDLNETVTVAMAHLANQIKETEAKITVEKLPKISGDSSQLLRLFQNLLDNAIKFKDAKRKPEILISVTEDESVYVFSVKDNGIGIEKKFFDRIFVIFQRLHSRAEYEGTGVGLAVCKKIAERHGGDIWVESEAGKGSTFFFTIKKK